MSWPKSAIEAHRMHHHALLEGRHREIHSTSMSVIGWAYASSSWDLLYTYGMISLNSPECNDEEADFECLMHGKETIMPHVGYEGEYKTSIPRV